MPPTAIAQTTSRPTPIAGSRHERVQMVATNSTAHISAATARIALVGITACTSV